MDYKHKTGEYGSKVNYEDTDIIDYPDFSISFMGHLTRKVDSLPPFGSNYFYVQKDDQSKQINTTPNDGLISPDTFEIDGKKYQFLVSNGLTITPEND